MDSKLFYFILFSFTMLFSCKYESKIVYRKRSYSIDTINIKCFYLDKDFNISGKRIFPAPYLKNIDAIKEAEKTHIFSILERKDTLYIFSIDDFFSDNLDSNNFLPLINDSTIKILSSRKYQINKDPDPPNWTVIENGKDTIIVRLAKIYKNDNPSFIFATIQDTIFEFSNGIKVGIDKKIFFKKTGNVFLYKKKNFTVIYTSVFDSNVSWYYKYLGSIKENDFYYKLDKFRSGNLKYLFKFKDNKLVKILIFT